MSGNMLSSGSRRAMDWLLVHATYLIAMAMMVYSVAEIVHRAPLDGFLYVMAMYTVPFVCGLLILLDRHHSIFFAVGLFAISIGFSRLLKYLPMVMEGNSSSIVQLLLFCVGLVLTILALNMIYSGFRYIRRNSRSITSIIIATGFFTAVLVVDVIAGIRSSEDTLSFLAGNGNNIARLIMYILYIGIVWSAPVRDSTSLARMERVLVAGRLDEGAGPDLSMYRESADRFVGFVDGSIRGDLPVSGPVVERTRISAHDGLVWMVCDVERWDDGGTYMVVSESGEGSLIDPSVLAIRSASLEDDAVLVRYSGGKTGRFRIRSRDEDDISVSEAIA